MSYAANGGQDNVGFSSDPNDVIASDVSSSDSTAAPEESICRADEITIVVHQSDPCSQAAAVPDVAVEPGTNSPPHQRKPLNQKEFLDSFHYQQKPRRGVLDKARSAAHSTAKQGASACSQRGIGNFVVSLMPMLSWLPQYSVKKNIVGDAISGVTVAVMHIPQG